MTRKQITIGAELHRKLKEQAAREGKSLMKLIEEYVVEQEKANAKDSKR